MSKSVRFRWSCVVSMGFLSALRVPLQQPEPACAGSEQGPGTRGDSRPEARRGGAMVRMTSEPPSWTDAPHAALASAASALKPRVRAKKTVGVDGSAPCSDASAPSPAWSPYLKRTLALSPRHAHSSQPQPPARPRTRSIDRGAQALCARSRPSMPKADMSATRVRLAAFPGKWAACLTNHAVPACPPPDRSLFRLACTNCSPSRASLGCRPPSSTSSGARSEAASTTATTSSPSLVRLRWQSPADSTPVALSRSFGQQTRLWNGNVVCLSKAVVCPVDAHDVSTCVSMP
jgi:hypothetical protein